jgi:hypothetical protein
MTIWFIFSEEIVWVLPKKNQIGFEFGMEKIDFKIINQDCKEELKL